MAHLARLALFAALLAAGCAPLPRAELCGLPITDRVPVTWEGEPGAVRAELERFVDEAELVYRARFGVGAIPVRGIVFHDEHLLTATVAEGHSSRLLGYVTPGGVIHLPWRGTAPGRAIVHELHHLAAGRGEPGHAGHGWRVADYLGAAWWQEFWWEP